MQVIAQMLEDEAAVGQGLQNVGHSLRHGRCGSQKAEAHLSTQPGPFHSAGLRAPLQLPGTANI